MNDYRIVFSSCSGGRTRSILISPQSVCKLIDGGLAGFDSAELEIKMRQYGSVSGGYVEKRRFRERRLALTFELRRGHDPLRRKLSAMMTDGADCVLDVTLGGVRRKISVIPDGGSSFIRENLSSDVTVKLCFVAPDVFFTSYEPTVVPFSETVPLLTFPFVFRGEAGVTVGLTRRTNTAKIANEGDGECGYKLTLTARGGSVVNPKISSGGKFVRILATLSDGDKIELDTSGRQKSIKKNGIPCYTFDRDSIFFPLSCGENEIVLTADTGGESIDGMLEFSPIYYGI